MTSTTHQVGSNAVPSQVWLARAGRRGEDEAVALELGLAVIDFTDIPDLTGVSDSEAVLERVRQACPEAKVNWNRNRATQLNAFVLRIKEGDLSPSRSKHGQVG